MRHKHPAISSVEISFMQLGAGGHCLTQWLVQTLGKHDRPVFLPFPGMEEQRVSSEINVFHP